MKIRTTRAIETHNPVVHGGRFSVNNQDPDILDFSSNVGKKTNTNDNLS